MPCFQIYRSIKHDDLSDRDRIVILDLGCNADVDQKISIHQVWLEDNLTGPEGFYKVETFGVPNYKDGIRYLSDRKKVRYWFSEESSAFAFKLRWG